SLETVFATLKHEEAPPSQALFDLFHQTINSLGNLLVFTEVKRTASEKAWFRKLLHRLENAAKAEFQQPIEEVKIWNEGHLKVHKAEGQQPLAEEKLTPAETVRISTAKLGSLLLQTEELLSAKVAASQRAAELKEIKTAFGTWKKEWAKYRIGDPGLRNAELKKHQFPAPYPQLNEFLDWNSSFAKSLESQVTSLTRAAEQDHRSLSAMVDGLLEDMKKVLMLPFSSILEIFPKLIRDLSRDQGKEVELQVQGGEIEVDIHLVRNCIDHGIEKPEEREGKQKLVRGTIKIAVSQKEGSRVEILLSDDGAGIDLAKVRSAAVRLGMLSEEESDELTEKELHALIFQSEVSTSPMITDISGRGLGLAIVREKVEKLGGAVSLETHVDKETTFRVLLPLTLARFWGILVRVGEHLFVLPATYVERVGRLKAEEIRTAGSRETILLDGQAISLARLGVVLALSQQPLETDSAEHLQWIVLGSAERRIGFLVDEILNEQEVVVKSLGKQLSRVCNIAGATVLGSGRVVPVLNVSDLMKSAVKVAATPAREVSATEPKPETKTVLIVEDSITARALLKGILETAGYRVKVAVDGMEGLTAVKSEDFDLVISDVEMPRMDGFELTAKIRADKKLSELPVVLVTALESREDRERGIEVGASAYIVKSSFDQGNLLGAVRRLI
ncbi:MAG: hybrid sensor histidine kinase/response regulator, partial [Acidobacteria bacterium]